MENNLYTALSRYFKRLSQVGYVKTDDLYILLIYTYIYELLKRVPMNRTIENVLSCLQQSCFVPRVSCKETCS